MKGGRRMKYRGLVKNRINGEIRKTRRYNSYKEAHRRAELLGVRVYGRNENWNVDVVVEEE